MEDDWCRTVWKIRASDIETQARHLEEEEYLLYLYYFHPYERSSPGFRSFINHLPSQYLLNKTKMKTIVSAHVIKNFGWLCNLLSHGALLTTLPARTATQTYVFIFARSTSF
jgi:hypothetical protein